MQDAPVDQEVRSRITFIGGLLALAAYLALLWWAAVMAGFSWGDDLSSADLAWVGGSLSGFLAGLVVVQVPAHEVGHLVAAILMRMPVLGLRVGPFQLGVERRLPRTAGHVLVDVTQGPRWLPGRMVVVLLAGPVANLALAAVTAGIATDPSRSLGLRSVAAGVTMAGLYGGIGNLIPVEPMPGSASDGRRALRWILRPGSERARVQLAVDLARLRVGSPATSAGPDDRRAQLLAAADDARPEVAVAAMVELLTKRPGQDDRWQDYDHVVRFTARTEIDGAVRATLGGNYSLSLAMAHLSGLGPGEPTDPLSSDLLRIADLAELARAADRESLPARTAYGLVRICQDRPQEARSALIDVPDTTPAAQRARALAVRGIAETELGALDQAVRLGRFARHLAPDDLVVRLLDVMLELRARS